MDTWLILPHLGLFLLRNNLFIFSSLFLNELNSSVLISEIFVKISSLESLEIYHPKSRKNIPLISEFDEFFLGHYISQEEFSGAVRFVIRDLENFRFSTEITVLPFFFENSDFLGFHIHGQFYDWTIMEYFRSFYQYRGIIFKEGI